MKKRWTIIIVVLIVGSISSCTLRQNNRETEIKGLSGVVDTNTVDISSDAFIVSQEDTMQTTKAINIELVSESSADIVVQTDAVSTTDLYEEQNVIPAEPSTTISVNNFDLELPGVEVTIKESTIRENYEESKDTPSHNEMPAQTENIEEREDVFLPELP